MDLESGIKAARTKHLEQKQANFRDNSPTDYSAMPPPSPTDPCLLLPHNPFFFCFEKESRLAAKVVIFL